MTEFVWCVDRHVPDRIPVEFETDLVYGQWSCWFDKPTPAFGAPTAPAQVQLTIGSSPPVTSALPSHNPPSLRLAH